MKSTRYYDLVMTTFVAILLVSNIASSAKIIDLGISWHGVPLAFDGGTLLFPLSYIFGDILTEVYGFRRARRVICIGFACMVGMSSFLLLLQVLPGEATWQTYAGDAMYRSILGAVSSGGIVAASVAGYLAGAFSNSYVLARMKVAMQGKMLWLRTIGSTIVGEGVDTVAFLAIASSFGIFPWSIFWSLAVSNYLFKVGVEILFTPITYAAVHRLKHAEREDYYDAETNFNPFSTR